MGDGAEKSMDEVWVWIWMEERNLMTRFGWERGGDGDGGQEEERGEASRFEKRKRKKERPNLTLAE